MAVDVRTTDHLDVRERLDDPELASRAVDLGFGDRDLVDLVKAVHTVRGRKDDLGVVTGLAHRLVDRIGRLPSPPGDEVFADVPESPMARDGVLAMLALLATVPDVVDFHARRGVAAEISLATLGDLGQQVRLHRRMSGAFGLHTYAWLTLAWSGALYRLGRLQFNLELDVGLRGEQTWVLSTHIPATGPLTPGSVDASFAMAAAFFAAHFPDYVRSRPACPVSAATTDFVCRSWLLDPALSTELPGSNLAAFQRRWHIEGAAEPGEIDSLYFIFNRRPPVDAAALPRDTRLRRLTADKLAAGHGWGIVRGRVAPAPQ